jgi:hypothetical protein
MNKWAIRLMRQGSSHRCFTYFVIKDPVSVLTLRAFASLLDLCELFSIGSVYNIRVEIGLRAIVGYNAKCYSHNKQLSDPQVNSSWTSASLTA